MQVLFSINVNEQYFLVFLGMKKNCCKHDDKESYFLILLLAGSLILDKLFNLSES